MAITKNIIELMNGTVSVESEKNKGTTFTVTVTLTDCDHQNDGEAENVLHTHELCVLVIDDDPIACEHAHLCKPVEPDVLFKTLESLLHD